MTAEANKEFGTIVAFMGAGQPMEVQQHPLPVLKAGEVLVKNLYTTLCGSDLHTYCGTRLEKCPTVLAHEIIGAVLALADGHPGVDAGGNPLQIGDRVTWSVFASDPESENALRGMPQKGENLFKYGHEQISETDVFHGGLATHCVLRAGTVVLKLPLSIPMPVAATINCAIATVAGALRLSGSVAGKRVLVTGMGLLGLTCLAMCHHAGASLVAGADIHAERLLPIPAFGGHQAIDLSQSASDAPHPFDLAFDMSGAPEAMEFGLKRLALGGTAVWVGAVFKQRPVAVDAEQVIRKLITIKGLHNYNAEDLKQAVQFMSSCWEKYPFGAVVSKEFDLAATEDAFRFAMAERPLRVGIYINNNT